MEAALEEQRFRAAVTHFVAFFSELESHFVERDELIRQIALALLAREHVLVCGPPGTAKSQVASAVLRRIVDEETREPSLYARQFTESTVQTDLIGPINFKTLTETGRTEHFTDEGILGAVHAFLDEVFDGRDMLLRSTLNVLHERELKQGGTTRKGRIECAVMTTNRYLSEILEQSRENLLAFIDRIAFVCFVPKGFAGTESVSHILRTQVAGERNAALRAPLTIQDVDVLQHVVARVRVPAVLCDALARLVATFDIEIAAAVRADPTFVPTRYLSTRTVVRLGALLRAICVYDHAFRDPKRPLVACHEDLRALCLALVLSGPKLEDIERLLAHETDPRERRQLSILRTEKEIFQKCFSRLAPPAEIQEEEVVPVTFDLQSLDVHAETKLLADDLARGVLASGLTAQLEANDPPLHVAHALAAKADELEAASGERRPSARWLRGRALEIIHRSVRLAPTAFGAALEQEARGAADPQDALLRVRKILARLEEAATIRDALRAGGALEDAPEIGNLAWREAVDAAADDVVRVWDATFRMAVDAALGAAPALELPAIIQTLDEPLRGMSECDEWIARFDPGARGVRDRVVSARLGPVVQAAFERFDAKNRLRVAEQVEATLSMLEAAGLAHALHPPELLAWTAEALLRTENLTEEATFEPTYQGYRKHRLLEQRVSCTFVLADLARRLLPGGAGAAAQPHVALEAIRAHFEVLPREIRERTVALDIDRVLQPVALLEAWWNAVRKAVELKSGDASIDVLVRSKFFRVTMDEQALIRYELDLELLRRVAGAPSEVVDNLERRVRDLAQRSMHFAHELLSTRSEIRWAEALSKTETAE